ncbi:DUF262 domain-containing protein [bacterium]|nr:MAG: DUF262 domain-containing protein [bacterium]
MNAHKLTLGEILAAEVRLVAPLFQRAYVWKREQNWEPLWRALSEILDRRANGVPQRPYFMGALVLNQMPTPIGEVPSREIIDGQQRMTTLQILMETARRTFAESGFEHSARQLEKLTRNDLESESDARFKVWPTNVDRDSFRGTMKGELETGLMAEAAQYFRSVVPEWLRPGEEGARERAAAFVMALRQDLIFIAIDLENDDDGQLIFETLNSMGTPLLPSDLVKNLLFREAVREGEDAEKLYNEYWKPFESSNPEVGYWRETISVGRRERTRLDVFLQYYLTYRLGQEPVVAHQFRDYQDAFRAGKFGDTRSALSDFAAHAALFREFDEARTGAAGRLRQVLDMLDATVPNPLVLGFFANLASGEERDSALEMLESYLMRRLLCGLTTKNLNRVTADLITKLRFVGWNPENLREALLAYDGNSTVWPDDGFVLWRQRERAAYGDIRGTGISYALSRVEASLRTTKSEHPWNVRTPLTIEHLMPQKWREHWPLLEGSDEDAARRRDELLDRIGNLTVLTRRLNSSISNGSWSSKRAHLNEHTVLLTNSALAGREEWNEAAIIARSEELGRAFCRLWPR